MDETWYISYDDIVEVISGDKEYKVERVRKKLLASSRAEAEKEFLETWPRIESERTKRQSLGGNLVFHNGKNTPILYCEIPLPSPLGDKEDQRELLLNIQESP